MDPLVQWPREFGAFHVSCHGISSEELRSLVREFRVFEGRETRSFGFGRGRSVWNGRASILDMKYTAVSGIGPLLGLILNKIGTGFVINSTHFWLIVFCLNKIEFGYSISKLTYQKFRNRFIKVIESRVGGQVSIDV